MSETAGPRPVQLRIVDDLRKRIASGELQPGSILPSYRTLMTEYGVATQTVQRAIGILMTEGVVESRRGKGVFVRERPELITRRPPADEDDPHRPDGLQYAEWPTRPPKDVSAALGLDVDTEVLARHSIARDDEKPVEIITTYYSARVLSENSEASLRAPEDSSVAELRRLGHAPRRVTELTQTRMPTPEEARVLGLAAGVAVFRVLRSVIAEDGYVLEVQEIVLAGDRYQLLYELPLHD